MLKGVALVLLLCAKDEGKRKKAWPERMRAGVTQEDVKDSVR